MESINCIVVDDEPIAISILEKHIVRYGQLRLVAKCPNALEAFDALHSKQVDLIFLDIKMPAINGIDFLKSLKHPPKIIFTTAFSEHAIDGYELDVVDFLLKPITYERFERSMEKLFRRAPVQDAPEKEYSFFKVSGQLVKVYHGDIRYARSVKDYVQLITTKGSMLTYMTMKQLAELLPNPPFVRIHRSYMVNTQQLQAVGKRQVQVADEWLPIGKMYRLPK